MLARRPGGVSVNRMKWTAVVAKLSLRLLLLVALCQSVGGCWDGVEVSPPHRLREFEAAGADGPTVDLDRIMRAHVPTGPYRVVIGDVLRLELPVVLYPDDMQAGAATGGRAVHTCRVDSTGAVILPDGRQVAVAGRSLTEVESAVVSIYYPDLVRTRPAVYAQVLEYQSLRVQIVGAVASPGIYRLRHDQMSLVSLLMEAGGIIDEGAALIRIARQERADGELQQNPAPGVSGGSEAGAGYPARPTRRWGATRIRFQQEGPLVTTGWLAVEIDGQAPLRRWLDIASPAQMEEVLDAAKAQSGVLLAGQVRDRISRLAGHLMSERASSSMRPAIHYPDLEWERRDPRNLMTYLPAASGDRSAGSQGTSSRPVKAIHEGTESETPYSGDDLTLVLPVRGLNIPLTDVPLREGDAIVVERPRTQYVSVLGLVGAPGRFPFPPNTEYTLAEALASAGGMDLVADPRYVSIYRLRSDGTVASATYELVNSKNQESLTEALALKLKPGDVVSVEQTPRTRTNLFLDRVFRISLGLYLRPEEAWN